MHFSFRPRKAAAAWLTSGPVHSLRSFPEASRKVFRTENPARLSLWSTPVPFPTLLFPQGSQSLPEHTPHFPLFPSSSSRCVSLPFFLLSSKGPCFCTSNMSPEPISSTAHFFHLCVSLNKLFLRICVLALNFSLSQNSRREVAELRF